MNHPRTATAPDARIKSLPGHCLLMISSWSRLAFEQEHYGRLLLDIPSRLLRSTGSVPDGTLGLVRIRTNPATLRLIDTADKLPPLMFQREHLWICASVPVGTLVEANGLFGWKPFSLQQNVMILGLHQNRSLRSPIDWLYSASISRFSKT